MIIIVHAKICALIQRQNIFQMQSDLERMNEFDINNMNLMQFREVLECLKLSYQLRKKWRNPRNQIHPMLIMGASALCAIA